MSVQAGSESPGNWLGVLALRIHLAHVRHLNYAADFVAPAPPIVPFSFMTYQQVEEQTALKKHSRKWQVNAASRPRPAMCSVAHRPSMKSAGFRRQLPADLVVMPTHGRTGLRHVFLGSTAERIVQHSSCPVLIQRGNALQRDQWFTDKRLKPSLSLSTFPVAHGKVFATRLRSRMNLERRSFCCTRHISDMSIRARALLSTIFLACKRLPGKLPSAKCASLVRSVDFGYREY